MLAVRTAATRYLLYWYEVFAVEIRSLPLC